AEKDDGSPGTDAREAVGSETAGCWIGPVLRLDQGHTHRDKEQDDPDLEQYHRVVRVGRLTHSADQENGDRSDDEERGKVDDEGNAEQFRGARDSGGEKGAGRVGGASRDRNGRLVSGAIVGR